MGQSDWTVVDCRFTLAEPEAGRRAYRESHIAGAVYAHMNEDLSGPVIKGKTGRHPLPAPKNLADQLGKWGIDASSQVVVYDASGGSMAVRLWWLLRWLGHDRVAVLDGGWQAWLAAGYPVSAGPEERTPRVFAPHLRADLVLDTVAVDRVRGDERWRVLDARTAERFRGESETIDPVAGHIPGAISAPYAENLNPTGHFRSREELRARYQAIMGSAPADHVVCYCGSGITSIHDILAMAHAGLGEARLYPGSWSEWITDPGRPTAR
jgi:thiosulfate/3-mercaptopyruvate sulfurtransferase